MKMLSAMERVFAGIRVLSMKDLEWPKKINLETLDMNSAENNLLVQLYGSYRSAREALQIDMSTPLGQLGFRRINWVSLNPRSVRAVVQNELEREVWKEICETWPRVIRQYLSTDRKEMDDETTPVR